MGAGTPGGGWGPPEGVRDPPPRGLGGVSGRCSPPIPPPAQTRPLHVRLPQLARGLPLGQRRPRLVRAPRDPQKPPGDPKTILETPRDPHRTPRTTLGPTKPPQDLPDIPRAPQGPHDPSWDPQTTLGTPDPPPNSPGAPLTPVSVAGGAPGRCRCSDPRPGPGGAPGGSWGRSGSFRAPWPGGRGLGGWGSGVGGAFWGCGHQVGGAKEGVVLGVA